MKNHCSKPKIIAVCGPTGVGKTSFAIKLAGKFHGEIVGADSMQVYRHMDIGTAKPTPDERAAITHHVVDCVDPNQTFSAADYAVLAAEAVQNLLARGIRPFVVGGTGLYIKTLVYGLFKAPSSDEALRQRLRKEVESLGSPNLYRRLAILDPRSADRIHPNDAFRITRALEVLESTGRPISFHQDIHGFRKPRYDVLFLGLAVPREQLYTRINQRVDQMLEQGFLSEVRDLLDRGYAPDLKSMQSLGYRHMVEYIQGVMPWDEAVRTLKRDHRRYAKRQMTWFGRVPSIHWLTPDSIIAAQTLVTEFLTAK